jgi:hypothetical protein
MKRFMKVMGILSIAVVLVAGFSYGQQVSKITNKAVPNLSFPMIATDIIQIFYQQVWVDSDLDTIVDDSEWILDYDIDNDGTNENTLPTPIPVSLVIIDSYDGSYNGNEDELFYWYTLGDDGCAMDINSETIIGTPDGVVDDYDRTSEDMETWLRSMAFWYDQPVEMLEANAYDPNLIWNVTYIDTTDGGGKNSWQADWYWTGDVDGDALPDAISPAKIYIDFIDWGNPLENIYPRVGRRFPVEVALYEKLETPMTAYKMACLEHPGTKIELFGTSDKPNPDPGSFTYGSYFATVLTNKFFAEIWCPDGTMVKIPLGPGIGPSGKMNFASNNGGWIPTMPGWHRIWLHLNDPMITLEGAKVNNDEHYIMWTGCEIQGLNPNKLEQTGITGDSTFIDVYVSLPNKVKTK